MACSETVYLISNVVILWAIDNSTMLPENTQPSELSTDPDIKAAVKYSTGWLSLRENCKQG